MAASSSEMLVNSDGLVVNAYHNAEGRGNYFPGSAGTSEGQFLFIIGNIRAYLATGNPIAKEMAELALKNVLRTVYRNMPVPDVVDRTHIFAPHWLFNVKYPFNSSTIYYDRTVQFTNGVGYINDTRARYVYNARTLDSVLLWDNPYSPLIAGTQFGVISATVPTGVRLQLAAPYNGALFVTHSIQDGDPVQISEPFEAWPDWRKMEPGEIACAADVFVWAHRAFSLAARAFPNPTWIHADRATKEQAAIAFDINDSRDWIKPSWAKSAFAVGSRFSYSSRVPAPVFAVDQSGNVVVTVPTYGGGGKEVQYGNASVLDVYGANDVTTVEIGSSTPVTVSLYIDPAQGYVEENRYTAQVGLAGNGLQTLQLNRNSFVSSGTWGSSGAVAVEANLTVTGVGNYKAAGSTEAFNQLGRGSGKNSQGHTIMARLLNWRGRYNAQQFDLAVINGDQLSDRTDATNIAAWLAGFTGVNLLRADGSVLLALPLNQLSPADIANGRVYSRLYENSSALNTQMAEYLANPGLVKFIAFTGSTNETIQLYGRAMPVNMPVYTFGVQTSADVMHTLTIGRVRQTPPRDVAYYPGAIPFTANFQGNPAQLIDWRGPVYMGYQSPYMWLVLGNKGAATTDVTLLSDAQQQWKIQTGAAQLGPFAPVFIFDRADAVQYGPANTFGWEGPDPNTRWGGYQYRPLPELIEASSYLAVSDPMRISALRVAQNFLNWLAQDWAWLPMWAPWSNKLAETIERACALSNEPSPLQFPDRAPLGPPTDYPQGPAEINYPEPHMAALIMRSVVQMDALVRPDGNVSGVMQVEHRALMSKCMGLLDAMWIETGVMAGTFSGAPAEHEWYGFWHGEILDTLGQVYTWANRSNIARPATAAQVKIWIDGMLRFSKSSVMPAADVYPPTPWRFVPNWGAGIQEDFEFATNVFEAFSGKEQRISVRNEPRRQLTMRHLLQKGEAQGYDALLRARQNQPMLVPQWHQALRVIEDARAGQDYIVVEPADMGAFKWGYSFALARDNGPAMLLKLSSVDGNRINLAVSLATAVKLGDRAMPALNGLIDQDQSATHSTGTVLTSQASFRMLPQDDLRELPVRAPGMMFTVGADSREVITRRPNWAKDLSSNQTWEFNTSETYNNGPIVPVNGRSKGARSVQALWTLKSREEIDDHLGLVRRLHGRRYACWLPSWVDDFTLTRGITNPSQLYVQMNSYLDIGTTNDPAVALFVRLRDGRSLVARVNGFVELGGGEALLTLDRSLGATAALSQVEMVSLLYRVRQMSDTSSINWVTDSVAETAASFISVYGEV